MIALGTRSRSGFLGSFLPSRMVTATFTRDAGMTKLVTASCTFVNSSTAQVQAANGTFSAFAVGDPILVEGANLNNGYFEVTGIDTTNQSYLVVAPPPKNEGPLTVTIRTT